MAGTANVTAWRDVDLARVKLLADGADGMKRSWIMLMPQGEFEHPQYGKLSFSRKKLEEFKANFDSRVRKIDIALDQDHDGGKATGWLEQLQLRDGGLWGLVRWTSLGEQLLKDQIYRYFSPEFGDFTDPESGKKFSNVIIGGALTNRPFLKSMPAVQLAEKVSRKPWSNVNKSMLPASCFLIVPDRSKRSTWRLPVYEGAGNVVGGVFEKRGPLNINAVRAAIDALGGARTGKPMAGVPSGLRARLEGMLKRYGGSGSGSAAASEGAGAVAGRKSRKLADPEPEAEDEQQQDEQEQDLELEEEDEDLEELAEDDGEDEAESDDEGEPQTFADAKAGKSKSGKSGKKPANDAEDAADGGADEDEELDDMMPDDETYDDADGDGEQDMPAPKSGRGKGKGSKGMMPAANAKKMTETQMLSELTRLREENKTLREDRFKLSVSKKLSEFTRNIRSAGDDEEFALPRSFKLAYQSWMLSHGLRLSESQRDGLDKVILTALKVGTVPLISLANKVERGEVVSMDDRRPRTGMREVDLTPDAEKIALAEHKKPLSQLALEDPDAVAAIYFRLEEARSKRRSGEPAA